MNNSSVSLGQKRLPIQELMSAMWKLGTSLKGVDKLNAAEIEQINMGSKRQETKLSAKS